MILKWTFLLYCLKKHYFEFSRRLLPVLQKSMWRCVDINVKHFLSFPGMTFSPRNMKVFKGFDNGNTSDSPKKPKSFIFWNLISWPWHPENGTRPLYFAFPGGTVVKNLPANIGDMSLIPGSGRSGGGNGNPLQCSCLENPMDRRSQWVTVHGVSKESDMTEHTCLHSYI